MLRRFTVALTATSMAFAGVLYLQVSGTLGGVASFFNGAQASDTAPQAPTSEGVQPPAGNPVSGSGVPIARSGGS